MKPLTCSSCAANHLVMDDGVWRCEYCGATYTIDVNVDGSLADAKVTGNMQKAYGVYAVHGRLKVNGNMNNVIVYESARDALHVNNLVVNGNMNDLVAVLLDGATCEVRGSMNDVRRKRGGR